MRVLNKRSGFGQVYEAYERSIPKILKVLKEVHNHNPKAVQLFEQEAQVLSQLQSSGVPHVEPEGYFKFYPRNGSEPMHCLVMEKIDGPNLKEWMRQQGNHPISESQAMKWLEQVVQVLNLVHQRNYFHRDIKPENIMLRSGGQVVLVDFGAAREMTETYLNQLDGSLGMTRISSAGYTPPEQEKGLAVPQSDFYALGWTFIFLLTGRQPTNPEIYDSLNDSYNWRRFAPHVSAPFAEFIDRLIAPKASGRPKSTQDILAMLKSLRQQGIGESGMPTGGLPTTREISLPSLTGGAETMVQGSTHPLQASLVIGKWRGDRRLWVGIASVLVGLASWGSLQVLNIRQQAIIPSISSVPSLPSDQQQLSVEAELVGHTAPINTVIFTANSQTIISAGADTNILVWDRATGEPAQQMRGHRSYINALELSGDGRLLASGSADTTVRVWDMETGEQLQQLTGHTSPVNAVRFSPNKLVISGSADRTVRVWDVDTGKSLRTLTDYEGFVNAIALNPVASEVAAAGTGSEIVIWNYETGERLQTLSGFSGALNALVYSPDGASVIASGTDRTIRVWNAADGTLQQTLEKHSGFVNSLMISGDGRRLLSSDSDGQLIQWDLLEGRAIATYTSAERLLPLDHVSVQADWRYLATGRGYTSVRLWKLPQ